VTESAPGVEDGSVQSTGKGSLTVGGETVGNDASLGSSATWIAVKSARLFPFHPSMYSFQLNDERQEEVRQASPW
jgi:hypothetical protein